MAEWKLLKEKRRNKTVFAIRRWNNGTIERYPAEKYRRFKDDPLELQNLVRRLNAPIIAEQAKKRVELKHAFIDSELLDRYLKFLLLQIPTEADARTEFSYLQRFFLNFFIGKLNLANPVDWHWKHKTDWAEFLLSNDAPRAAETKKRIVKAANRFIKWLHDERPAEVPPLKFDPISKAKYKEIEAKRVEQGIAHNTQIIKADDWVLIQKHLPDTIRPYVMLAYWFGLRRSETLGLSVMDIRKDFLSVERQTLDLKRTGPLKGREKRRIPFWYTTQSQVYNLLTSAVKMHPDTLTDRWNELMGSLELTYTFHDLRHTFITRAIREYNPRDVQLAAGHKNIETTMRYAHDDRTLNDEVWKPA